MCHHSVAQDRGWMSWCSSVVFILLVAPVCPLVGVRGGNEGLDDWERKQPTNMHCTSKPGAIEYVRFGGGGRNFFPVVAWECGVLCGTTAWQGVRINM